MKRFRQQKSGANKLSHAPSGRQTMRPDVPETVRSDFSHGKSLRQRNRELIERECLRTGEGDDQSGSSKKCERASSEKWKQVGLRAGEIAMNKGKRPEAKGKNDTRRAKRELLGLQTLPNPDNPAVTKAFSEGGALRHAELVRL